MKVLGLDGRTHAWNPVGNTDLSRNVSSFHAEARLLLKSLYPSERILEEVSLEGTSPILFADFLIPIRKMIVEVHGIQHYECTPFFHLSKRDFFDGKKRDMKKRQWCELNNFFLIELPYSESKIEWRHRILNFGKTES